MKSEIHANTDDAIVDADLSDPPTETPTEPASPPLRILRIATCDSLSGRSALTYHIGVVEANRDIQLRLFANSAKGYFCKDWVSMALIDLLLTKAKSFSSGDARRKRRR